MAGRTAKRSEIGESDGGARGRPRVRVLVGDHQPLFREALAREIKAWPEFELVGAVEADEILSALLDLRPDVAVLDPTSLDGEVQDEIFACARDGVRLLFISADASSKSYESIERGAVGCLTKASKPRELCDAVAAAARGDAYVATDAVAVIAAEVRLRNQVDRPDLSRREREVLQQTAYGQSTLQVARHLQIEPSTVKTHLRNIYKKLGASGRANAVALALRLGLID
jgi:DNA-binding NarL/FixJ family response regulator